MMLHNGRCGSTVVGDLLVQNPNIHWASELYAKLKARSIGFLRTAIILICGLYS